MNYNLPTKITHSPKLGEVRYFLNLFSLLFLTAKTFAGGPDGKG
jgi:hypothetical protein